MSSAPRNSRVREPQAGQGGQAAEAIPESPTARVPEAQADGADQTGKAGQAGQATWAPAPSTVGESTHGALTRGTPLPRRLAAWAGERFPLATTAVLLLAYTVAVLYGRALTHSGRPGLGLRDLVAFSAVWAFFVTARIVDEHKDYELDRIAHPQRVLSRGLVTLGHLRVVAAGAVLVQTTVVIVADRGVGLVFLWWAVTVGWAALAARDFFLGARITGRPVLYPLLHLPLSSLACLWMAQLGAGEQALPPAAVAVAGLGAALAWVVDLTRKLAPREGGRSYSATLGSTRAGALLAAAVAVLTVVLSALVSLGDGWPAAPLLLVVLALGAAPFVWRPSAARTGQAGVWLPVVVITQLAVAAGALGAGGAR